MKDVHICSFEAGPRVTARTKYAEFRDLVLAAGGFSAFEATDTPLAARMYTQLCRDPEIIVTATGYPWKSVARKPE